MSRNNGDNNVPNATVQPHTLCSLCQTFWKTTWSAQATMCAPQHLFHAPRQSQVVSNASLGCHFCSIIVASISGCTGCHGREQQPPGGDERPMYISIAMLDPDSGTFLITLFACEQSGVASHDQILNSHTLTLRPIRGMSACPEGAESPGQHQKQQAQEPLALSRLRTSTFSEASAEFIQSWIRECQTTHFLCGSDSLALELLGHGQTLGWPRRLLDLKAFEDQEKIRLIETEGMVPQVEYCALSYSWGLSKLYVLTSATLGDFHREIPLPTLPVLLRDAIQVARRLGFRYLWIDALCIMQDGGTLPAASDDWVDQAGKMSDIFGNATVTIAASECVDGTQNLIRSRNPLGQTICRLDSCAQIPYEVVPPCTPHCLSHSFDRAQYHLDSRAWVFQERILSPRTVHCTRNFIHLECRTELRCEAAWPDGDHCHHQGAVSKADYQSLFMFSACGLGLDGLDELAVDGFLGVWHQLVRRYCRTSLSRRPDFLVALAGLGTRIQQTWELTWSFGLWREHLLRDMLWYVRRGRGAPCRERAPTWSWASIEVRRGEVVHDPATRVSLVAEVTAAPEPSDFARQPSISMMEGEANKYSVRIVGQLRRGAPDAASTSRAGVFPHRNCLDLRDDHPECPFHPDCDLPENVELYSLLVAHVAGGFGERTTGNNPQTSSWETQVGLVLTPVAGRPSVFTRVGYFHHDVVRGTAGVEQRQPCLFDGAERSEVEIV